MITFRRANEQDIDFIIEAVIAAEKSGTDRLSYASIFGLELPKVTELLKNAILEDIPGQELALSEFIIAYIDNELAGTVCAWIEAAEGVSSAVLKANVLFYFLGAETIAIAAEKSKLIEPLNIPREAGTLQIESVYVRNKFRGLGVSNKLISEHIKDVLHLGDPVTKVQIHVAASNETAKRSYEKLGFVTKISKTCPDNKVLEFLPSDTRIMMELDISDLYKKGIIMSN